METGILLCPKGKNIELGSSRWILSGQNHVVFIYFCFLNFTR